jgi:hypothetical protein
MNMFLRMLCLAPLTLLADLADAPAPAAAPPPAYAQPDYHNYFQIGANYTRVNFRPSGENTFNGNLGGIRGIYEYAPANAFYAAVEGKYRQGTSSGEDGRRGLLILDAAERVGYTWEKGDWVAVFYSGFGFRFLGHDLRPSSTAAPNFNGSFFPPFISGETSLQLDYYDFYFPVGIITEYTFNDTFILGLSAQWKGQVFSTVSIRPLGGTYWTLTNAFGNVLVEMPLVFNLNKAGTYSLILTPFYERWQDGHSTAVSSGGVPLDLPSNNYNFYGADLTFLYSF